MNQLNITADSINVAISSEAVTNFKRVAYHHNFVVQPNLNMVQEIRVVTLDENGVPILERIAQDENLNPIQKQAALQRYADQFIIRQTSGAFVDAAGQVIDLKPGELPDGIYPQRDFFQGITLGDLKKKKIPISDDTSVAFLLYALIGQEITNLDGRKAL